MPRSADMYEKNATTTIVRNILCELKHFPVPRSILLACEDDQFDHDLSIACEIGECGFRAVHSAAEVITLTDLEQQYACIIISTSLEGDSKKGLKTIASLRRYGISLPAVFLTQDTDQKEYLKRQGVSCVSVTDNLTTLLIMSVMEAIHRQHPLDPK